VHLHSVVSDKNLEPSLPSQRLDSLARWTASPSDLRAAMGNDRLFDCVLATSLQLIAYWGMAYHRVASSAQQWPRWWRLRRQHRASGPARFRRSSRPTARMSKSFRTCASCHIEDDARWARKSGPPRAKWWAWFAPKSVYFLCIAAKRDFRR